jgi:hypothetical protein
MLRWDARLRQPAAREHFAQMAGVGAVGLGPPLRAAVSAGSARCASTPARRSSSTTNRQPITADQARMVEIVYQLRLACL